MANINPFPEAPWFSIDEDQYLVYLLKGYEIELTHRQMCVYFTLDGSLHREDGPAVMWDDGSVQYWQNSLQHREDGPAVIYKNGGVEYWLNDEFYSKEAYYKALKDGTY